MRHFSLDIKSIIIQVKSLFPFYFHICNIYNCDIVMTTMSSVYMLVFLYASANIVFSIEM
jgi:hypothetical protein